MQELWQHVAVSAHHRKDRKVSCMRTVACCPAERVATQTLGDLGAPWFKSIDVVLNTLTEYGAHITVVIYTEHTEPLFFITIDLERNYIFFFHAC